MWPLRSQEQVKEDPWSNFRNVFFSILFVMTLSASPTFLVLQWCILCLPWPFYVDLVMWPQRSHYHQYTMGTMFLISQIKSVFSIGLWKMGFVDVKMSVLKFRLGCHGNHITKNCTTFVNCIPRIQNLQDVPLLMICIDCPSTFRGELNCQYAPWLLD